MIELEKLEEYIWRWNNHYKMLKEIEKTNMDKDQIKI